MAKIKEAVEGKYLKAEHIENSKTKLAVIVSGGEYTITKFGKKLTIGINLDKCAKEWTINSLTAKNLSVYGDDSDDWIGKKVKLAVETTDSGQEMVVGYPEDADVVKKKDVAI